MRWRIQGSDIVDGKPVMLDVEAESAVDAVAHAHDRKMVVSDVARSRGRRMKRVLPYLSLAAAVALAVSTTVLVGQLAQVRRAAALTARETQGTLADLQASRTAAEGRVAFLEGSLSEREKQREASLRELTGRLREAEKSLETTRVQAGSLDRAGRDAAARAAGLEGKVGELSKEIGSLRKQHGDLQASLKIEKTRVTKATQDVSTAVARAAEAESRYAGATSRLAELAAQIKMAEQNAATLKLQLEQAKATEVAGPRHALAVSYDAALDFATLHVGKPAFEGIRGAPATKVSAAEPTHANTFTMQTDKERVFEATLVVCLAADAPREALADNQATLEKFLATFAPQWKSADTWLAGAFKQTAGKGEGELAVLMTEHYRVSVWGNKSGQYGVKVEPKGQD